MTAKQETAQPEKKYCIYCEKEIHGRDGKKYCNVNCKNNFNARILAVKRAKENQAFPKTIAQLKKNYRILAAYITDERDHYIPTEELRKQGFDRQVCTGAFSTNYNRYYMLYKVCFDYKWKESNNGITASYDPSAKLR
ncbi:MAG: hypothetical protein P0Y49_04760 [Candidatus Pedobacter colombiensis]|uniref:DUF2116 family Zn-ribbon domain-containing protein n=1 Tax=Candidatus Pedobacter colombiensis TaxID=3121371 RepID=A0AAJ6B9Q7_9SPHI|nr:hypothetical protein [Pedobacter sp.]WEK20448.1 MAG: hypothetical protein P0Y49_04760 [Pedobacter sp.]